MGELKLDNCSGLKINFRQLASKHCLRYWCVTNIMYGYEDGAYTIIDLNKTGEYRSYGTPYAALRYIETLYNNYKNRIGNDMIITLQEKSYKYK